MECRVKILKPLDGVFAKYQPEVGQIYDANYKPACRKKGTGTYAAVCVIDVLDKKIALKRDEYEILGV